MIITRVQDTTGDHIEPPLDQAWDDLTKLRWHAAVVAHDTGLAVTVEDGALRMPAGGTVPGWCALTVGRTATAPLTYEVAWAYLNGVSVGAREGTRALDQVGPDCTDHQ